MTYNTDTCHYVCVTFTCVWKTVTDSWINKNGSIKLSFGYLEMFKYCRKFYEAYNACFICRSIVFSKHLLSRKVFADLNWKLAQIGMCVLMSNIHCCYPIWMTLLSVDKYSITSQYYRNAYGWMDGQTDLNSPSKRLGNPLTHLDICQISSQIYMLNLYSLWLIPFRCADELIMYLHMTVWHNIHVNILILLKATCFDFQEVIIRAFSEHKT
jgi:hypothetical protein